MTLRQELLQATPPSDTAITIGTFDGVHLGHQYLLDQLVRTARRSGLLPLVLTFRNHPRSVLNPSAPMKYITDLETRLSLLAQRVDRVVAIDFTRDLSLLTAAEFVAILEELLRMKGLVVGADFALGHRRQGDVSTLRQLGSTVGFWVETLEPFSLEGRAVNSSGIRKSLDQGQVEVVSRMLGRPFSLTGVVVEGERRGRVLGFPTVNLSLPPDMALPSDGIYATWAGVEGQRYQSATSIGVRPTFGEGKRLVESFLMDFDGDLYGRQVTLEFAQRLREEMAFASAEALVEQMRQDVAQSRGILTGQGHAG